VESDHEEDVSAEKDEEKVVNMENIDLDDIHLGKTYSDSVEKRLRSNTGKVVPSETKTPQENCV